MKYILLFTLVLCSSGIYAMGEEATETPDSTPDPVIQMSVDDTQATQVAIELMSSDDAGAQDESNSGCILCTSKDKVNVKHAQFIQWSYRMYMLVLLIFSSFAFSDLDENSSAAIRWCVVGSNVGSAVGLGADALSYCIEKLTEK